MRKIKTNGATRSQEKTKICFLFLICNQIKLLFINLFVYWSRDTDGDTCPGYCTVIGGSSGDVIQTISNNIINYEY